MGLDPLPRATVMAAVGDGARKLIERAIVPDTDVPPGRLFAIFMDLYRADPVSGSATYPHVMDALAFWRSRGIPQAILTNKPHSATTPVVKALGLDEYCEGGRTCSSPGTRGRGVWRCGAGSVITRRWRGWTHLRT